MVGFYLLTFPRSPLRNKVHKSYFGKNRTHDFRTSRCAGYPLDHSGDERCAKITPGLCTSHPSLGRLGLGRQIALRKVASPLMVSRTVCLLAVLSGCWRLFAPFLGCFCVGFVSLARLWLALGVVMAKGTACCSRGWVSKPCAEIIAYSRQKRMHNTSRR